MSMQIHCPECGVRLDVPDDAGGRAARCPRCKTQFRVPDPNTMLDETVACWLDLDHLHADEEVEEQQELAAGVASPAESASDRTPATERAATAEAAAAGEVAAGQAAAPDHDKNPAKASRGSYVIDPEQMAELKRSGRFVAYAPDEIKLHVLDAGAFGVKVAFAAPLLDNVAFRASLPMRGILSGETDPAKLTARPLAWVDKATGRRVDPSELEGRYEMRVRGHDDARQVIRNMNLIQELAAPFNQPMPFYVSRDDAGKAQVHAETVASPYGIQCEVTIPCMRYALDWVGRVNGICGEDYLNLEKEVVKYDSAAWQRIPATVRGRIAVWFDFVGDEQFVAYFNDSDYSTADAGLGGLVVTTERLVYCKFHTHGAIDLSADDKLLGVESGKFATLYLQRNGSRRKLIRLRRDDLDKLRHVLEEIDAPLDVRVESEPTPSDKV